MKIISPHDSTGWITAIIADRWVQAKVYDEPSDYGINGGRVSKLCISKTSSRNPNEDFFNQMCYSYERGLDKRRGHDNFGGQCGRYTRAQRIPNTRRKRRVSHAVKP